MDDRRIFEEEWTIEETSKRKTRKRTGGNGQGVRTETYRKWSQNTEAIHQREVLAKMIGHVIAGFDKVIYPDWDSLLDTLNSRLDRKFTLCIDEFPYLISACPELPSILQKKLDSKELKYNLMPFAKGHIIVAKLFLKNRTSDETKEVLLPADVIQLMRLSY